MSNHTGDAKKIISDTPRTDEAYAASTGAGIYEFLERELNAANERIKRLEEAGNEIVWWFCPKDTSLLSSMQSAAVKRWNQAKEAKP